MIDLGTLYLKVEAKADKAISDVQAFGKVAETAEGKTSKLQQGLTIARKAFVATSAAITGAVVGIKKWADKVASTGDAIDKNSQKMRVSAEDYQAIAYAAELSGASVNDFMRASKQLSGTEWDGNLTGFLNSLMEIEDADERVALAQEMLGTRVTQNLMPFINGERDINSYKQELENLGGVMSDEAVKNSAAYQDALTSLQSTMALIGNVMAEKVLPVLTDIINKASEWVSNHQDTIDSVCESITDFINFFIEHSDFVLSVLAGIGTALLGFKVASIISAVTTALEGTTIAAAAFNAVMAVNPFTWIILGIAALVAGLVLLYKNWNKVKKLVKKGMKFVVNSAPVQKAKELLEKLKGAWDKVKNAVKKAAKFAVKIPGVQAAIDAFKKLKNWWDKIKGNHTANFTTKRQDAKGGSHRIGIREIPYDNYSATLHKGEAVLTAAEVNQYKRMLNNNSANNTGAVAVPETITVISQIDGRTVAKSTAPFMNKEIKNLNTRNSRKLGMA